MNPLRWVRWKVVVVLAVIGLAGYFVGLDRIALSTLNSAGRQSNAARWAIEDLAFGLLAGNAELTQLLVDTAPKRTPPREAPAAAAAPGRDGERVFNAAGVAVDVSTMSLLARRAIVEEVRLSAPQMLISRREDGSTNVGDLGEAPEEPETAPEGPPRDWVDTAKRWYDRIEKLRKWVPAKREPEQKESGAPWQVDYARAVTYPFADRPGIEIHRLIGENLEIGFRDAAEGRALPALKNGTLTIANVTSRPSVQKEPTTFMLKGDVEGAKLSLGGTVDFRGDRSLIDIEVDTGDLPASLVAAFVGPSLPVSLREGTIRVRGKVRLDGAEGILVEPRLAFKDVSLEAKDPDSKVAGQDAARFAKAFNEVSREIGEMEIADLRITGTLSDPRFEWGDTVKNLVMEGAKAFASKKATEAVDRGKAELEKRLDALPIPKEAAGVKDALGGQLEGVDAKKVLPGIFGERKKPRDEGTK